MYCETNVTAMPLEAHISCLLLEFLFKSFSFSSHFDIYTELLLHTFLLSMNYHGIQRCNVHFRVDKTSKWVKKRKKEGKQASNPRWKEQKQEWKEGRYENRKGGRLWYIPCKAHAEDTPEREGGREGRGEVREGEKKEKREGRDLRKASLRKCERCLDSSSLGMI